MQRSYCNWSPQQTQSWLLLTRLPFPASPWTCYLLPKLTNRKNHHFAKFWSHQVFSHNPLALLALSAFQRSQSSFWTPLISAQSCHHFVLFSLWIKIKVLAEVGFHGSQEDSQPRKKHLEVHLSIYSTCFTWIQRGLRRLLRADANPVVTQHNLRPLWYRIPSRFMHLTMMCICLSLEKKLLFFDRQVFLNLSSYNFNLTRTLSHFCFGQKILLSSINFYGIVIPAIPDFLSLFFSSVRVMVNWKWTCANTTSEVI